MLDVRAILADPAFDNPACNESRAEAIYALTSADADRWEAVRDEMLSLLADDGEPQHWMTAVTVLWLGVDRPMPNIRVIALLQIRLLVDLPPEQELDENLVWSITRNLQGVSYLSDYDPASDPDVVAEMARYVSQA